MPGGQPDITVAIATVGRDAELARCLDAIARGTAQPCEIVVVDQSSDQRGKVVVDQRSGPGAPIRHVPQARLGLSASRNAGIAAARTTFVAVTDDDCVPHEEWLATVSTAFSRVPAPDAVTGRVLPLGNPAEGYAVSSRTATSPADFRGNQLPWVVGTGGNMAVTRELWQRIGGYDERLGAGTRAGAGEDLDFIHRLLRAHAVVRYDPGAVVYHQRQSAARRSATRSAYGRGVGACCSAWVVAGDPTGIAILGHWIAMRAGFLAQGVRRGDWTQVREELLVLRGTASGLAHGARIGRRALER